MRKVLVIVHNEEGSSDVYYNEVGDGLWNILRDIQGKRVEHMETHEVDVLEKITSSELGFYKVDRFVREDNLSVFQTYDYVGENHD